MSFFTKKTLLLLVISLICTGGIFLFIVLRSISTFTDIQGLKHLNTTPNAELLANQKIQGDFRAPYSNLGIVSVRFTNFGKISTDSVVFRIRQKNETSWLYEHEYKVDQFQPNQFFTFGFPVQSNSSNREYVFEVESISGQKGDAIGLSIYRPAVQFTYAFSKNEFISKPKYTIEILHYFAIKKVTQWTMFLLMLGLLVLIFLLLFIVTNLADAFRTVKKNKKIVIAIVHYVKRHPLFFILTTGLLSRLLLAIGPFSADTNAFWHESMYPEHHIWNVYAHSNEHGYNYSPVIFFVFITLAAIHSLLHFISWPFLWRAFLTSFDLGTVYLLIQLAKIRKINPIQTAFLFFLNPVSILITGYHGQFENVAIFFLLLAVLFHYKTLNKKNPKLFLKWVYLTVSILVKHIIVYQLPVFWRVEFRKKYQIVLFFSLSIAIFLASFTPFWFGAQKLIIQNVFLYGGIPGYGIAYFFSHVITQVPFIGQQGVLIYKFIFIFLLFTLPLFITRRDILRNMLFMFLFFLTFTPGIGIQYFIVPIAFGALFPTKWFYLYTIMVGLVIEIIEQPIPIPVLQYFPVEGHSLWIIAAFWFVSEFFSLSKMLRRLYNFVLSHSRTT